MISEITITKESFTSLTQLHSDSKNRLDWNLVFTLPAWLKVWWQNFGTGADLFLRSVRESGQILGLAPLQIRSGAASIIGSVDVCDYQDFIIAPGREKDFYQVILDDLLKQKINRLHLETIRTDSTIVNHLIPLAKQRGYKIEYRQSDVSSDMSLPDGWSDYLTSLDGKQRHELKRKMRNLNTALIPHFQIISDRTDLQQANDYFLKLFPESREDKAEFMTPQMQVFFRSLVVALTEINVLRYGSLELDGKPIAMVMYFDYRGSYYLYNSAYDPAYRSLSVGIISKVLCIKDGIEKGKKRFDFLKGHEVYKSQLGGQEIPLYSCEILL